VPIKVRFGRLWNRLGVALIEIIPGALGTGLFGHRTAFRAAVTLDCVPWRREGAGVVDMHVHFQHLAIIDHAEALHDVKLFGMRRPEIIHEGPVV
jgi:hypothetical protein